MKVLQVHNQYQQGGGEDVVVKSEKLLLEKNSHEVISFYKSNDEIKKYSVAKKLALLWNTTWSKKYFNELSVELKKVKPDICHIHNTFPIISPSILYACQLNKIPIVITLHNYRLICANGQFFRNGLPCVKCLGSSSIHAIQHACYRNSHIQSFASANMIEIHKIKKTYTKLPGALICLTEFAKNKFIEFGIPEELLFIKPNFIFTEQNIEVEKENYFVFIGRLEKAKGTELLINLNIYIPNIRLKIIGGGDEEDRLKNQTKYEFTGAITRDKVLSILSKSKALIFTSIWYEGMPLVILEAFSLGIPVIASNIGAISEMIDDYKNGLLFEANNVKSLSEKIIWATNNPDEMKQMGKNAYLDFINKYSSQSNLKLLKNIYEFALKK